MFLKVALNTEYTCGQLSNFVFSGIFPYLVSTVVLIIKIAVPILLIIFGMIDLLKSVIAAKEDEIKKGQQTFIKRLITGAIVFLVISVIQILIRFLSSGEPSVMQCFNCFVHGDVSDTSSEMADIG